MYSNAALDVQHDTQPAFHQQISSALNDYGWSVVDNYVPDSLLNELLSESRLLKASGQFRQAGIFNGTVDKKERSDLINWINPLSPLPAQSDFLQQMDSLRYYLNRENYLGLFDLELHAAVYPSGSYYRKHIDNFHQSSRRILTVILYLNTNWQTRDEGQLRLYLPKKTIDIEPVGGRLVTFLSKSFHHEVLPTRRDRYSLTGWFRRNELFI